MKSIVPAILTESATVANQRIAAAAEFASAIQLDVMDGTFLAAHTYTLDALEILPTNLTVEVDLMVDEPEQYFAECYRLGAERVFCQLEALSDADATITAAADYDLSFGLSLLLETPVSDLLPYVNHITSVLLRGAAPGAMGRQLDQSIFERIAELHALAPQLTITIDGGVHADTLADLAATAASQFVVGSAIFNTPDPAAAYSELTRLIV